MVLQCKCGGALEIEDQNYQYDEDGFAVGMAFEKYRCASCDRTGTYEFGEQNGREIERKTGCVTFNPEAY